MNKKDSKENWDTNDPVLLNGEMAIVDGEGIKIGNGTSKYNELPFFLKPFVSGMIILWSGSIDNIPVGWALCNGQNGTPDLTDKFIIGAGNKYNIGATGGEEQVILTEEQIPSHNHDILNGAITNSTTSGTVTISTSTFLALKIFMLLAIRKTAVVGSLTIICLLIMPYVIL